jgi:hypothetical protein
VTNGPFVELRAGRQGPGDRLRLPGPGKVRVTAKVWWQLPLRRAELVQDGKVVATKELAADGPWEVTWEQEVPFERCGWLALRTSGPRHADNPSGEAFAHTSPIYVEVTGRPPSARADARYFVAWIDRLEVALRERDRLPTAADKAQVAAQMEAARLVYARIGRR